MRIRDWSIALEIDKKSAVYVQSELIKRETEREIRDRDFWTVMFGGEASGLQEAMQSEDGPTTLPQTDDEVIARSMLGRR